MKRLALFMALIALTPDALGAEVQVRSAQELSRAIQSAQPGDVITLAPGRYEITGIRIRTPGTAERPIILRAAKLGEAKIESHGVVGFTVQAGYWHFENLDIIGQCPPEKHSNCEHAFHIVGNSDGVEIRSSRLVNFNAAIKANGDGAKDGALFPDDVRISNVMIYNTEPRRTRNPVTPIDVVGGKRWRIEDNFLADYGRTDGVASYQGFLKGNSRDGVVTRNLAICNWRHSGPGRVGLSLGGGGTTNTFVCENQNCDTAHHNGVVIGNIVANCLSEPGLYLNAAANSRVEGNLFFKTTGIQLHTQFASADIRGNIFNGGIRDREGSQHTASANEIYGIQYGAFLPAVSAYIQLRLEGQDKKYPSIISPSMVEMAQSGVAWIFGIVIQSPLGLGYGAIEGEVVDPENFNLALREVQNFSQNGLTYTDSDTDFCGRSRASDTSAGPFVGSEMPCDPSDRIQRVLALEQEFPIQ